MQEHVKFIRKDGLTFSTESLTYDAKLKEIETTSPFLLEFNQSYIKGVALKYNSKKEELSNYIPWL